MRTAIAFYVGVSGLVFLALSGRYEMAATEGGVYRIDRLTGAVTRCTPEDRKEPLRLVCGVDVSEVRR